MKKRKIFIAIHQLTLGGAQKALIEALNAIDYEKNDVTLYVRKARLDLLSQVNPAVSNILINRDRKRYYRKPYAVWLHAVSTIRRLMKRSTADTDEKLRQYVVAQQLRYEQTHTLGRLPAYDVAISYIQGYTAQAVAKLVRADKKVMFYHDSTDSLHDLHCKVMRDYDRIYCVSKNAMEALRGFYPQFAEKIGCLENHIDAAAVRAKADVFTPDFPNGRLILCTCGRLAKVKGFDLAVAAADELKRRGMVFKWYFVGDGPDKEKTETGISEKGLTDSIELTGMLRNPYPYIKGCDIYIQPSYEEAQSLSVMEAQILGRPVVSTATAGGKALIEDGVNGLLADISAQMLADKIERLQNDAALRERITQKLAETDDDKDAKRFRAAWKKLLEED